MRVKPSIADSHSNGMVRGAVSLFHQFVTLLAGHLLHRHATRADLRVHIAIENRIHDLSTRLKIRLRILRLAATRRRSLYLVFASDTQFVAFIAPPKV